MTMTIEAALLALLADLKCLLMQKDEEIALLKMQLEEFIETRNA